MLNSREQSRVFNTMLPIACSANLARSCLSLRVVYPLKQLAILLTKPSGIAYVLDRDNYVTAGNGYNKRGGVIRILYFLSSIIDAWLSVLRVLGHPRELELVLLGYIIVLQCGEVSQIHRQRIDEKLSQRYAQGTNESQLLTHVIYPLAVGEGAVSSKKNKLLLIIASVLPNNHLRRLFFYSNPGGNICSGLHATMCA